MPVPQRNTSIPRLRKAAAFEGASAGGEIHRRLAFTDHSGVFTDQMFRRHGARDFKHPDELAVVVLTITNIVQRIFGVEAEAPPDVIRDESIESGAFIHFI